MTNEDAFTLGRIYGQRALTDPSASADLSAALADEPLELWEAADAGWAMGLAMGRVGNDNAEPDAQH